MILLCDFREQSHCYSLWPRLPSVNSHCALSTQLPQPCHAEINQSINTYCIVINSLSLQTVIKTTLIICSLHCVLPGQNQTKSNQKLQGWWGGRGQGVYLGLSKSENPSLFFSAVQIDVAIKVCVFLKEVRSQMCEATELSFPTLWFIWNGVGRK